jgi:choline dehydrogenase
MLVFTAFRLLASTLFAALSQLALLSLWTWPDNAFVGWPLPPWDATYDYVDGGGTAGITLASHLAQNRFHVALVEAGGYYEWVHPLSEIPGAATIGIGASISTASSVDWKFVAGKVPGANYRDIHYPRGK